MAAVESVRSHPPKWPRGRIARVGVLGLLAALFVYPILGFALAPFRTQTDILHSKGGFLGIGRLSWHSLTNDWTQVHAFNSGVIVQWIVHSTIIGIGGAIVAIVAAAPAGYAMARLRFRGRRILLFLTLLTMVMPNTVLVIPLFLEVSAVHQIDQIWPLVVILGFFPFGVYLCYIHFFTAMPHELVEAARIDGLSETAIFFRIAAPLAKQPVALTAFFAFVANWTNYFLPLVLLPITSQSTVSVGLQQLIIGSQMYSPASAAGLNVQLYMPELAFATLLTMLPVLVVFIAAQRFLVRGQTLGAVKG
jgi:multiple sugar transport system permease protein